MDSREEGSGEEEEEGQDRARPSCLREQLSSSLTLRQEHPLLLLYLKQEY